MRAITDEARKRRGFVANVVQLKAEPAEADSSGALADRDEIARVFERLSIEHRTIVVLYHYLGMTTDEAARTTGVPHGTAKSRLHYATRRSRRPRGDARGVSRKGSRMSTNRDPRRSIHAWLEAETPDRAPGRLIEASRERIRSTRQRRSWLPARRATDMNSLTKWAIAAAAVVVVAIVGYSLFPSRGGTASQATASPAVVAATSAAPSPVEVQATGGACVPRPVKFDPPRRST